MSCATVGRAVCASARTTALFRCSAATTSLPRPCLPPYRRRRRPPRRSRRPRSRRGGDAGFVHHRFPTCFVCGTARDDGLRIYPVASGTARSSPPRWTPESDDPLLVWAVLDCPSALAIESVDHRAQIVVLASLTVELRERPRAGERHVVAAWPVGSDGRKHHSASALYDATGRVLAVADASESSYETPPRSAAEPLDSLPIVLSRC